MQYHTQTPALLFVFILGSLWLKESGLSLVDGPLREGPQEDEVGDVAYGVITPAPPLTQVEQLKELEQITDNIPFKELIKLERLSACNTTITPGEDHFFIYTHAYGYRVSS